MLYYVLCVFVSCYPGKQTRVATFFASRIYNIYFFAILDSIFFYTILAILDSKTSCNPGKQNFLLDSKN
jgi:hypothetical protein